MACALLLLTNQEVLWHSKSKTCFILSLLQPQTGQQSLNFHPREGGAIKSGRSVVKGGVVGWKHQTQNCKSCFPVTKYIFKRFLSVFWAETKYEQDRQERPHPTEINRLLLCTDFTTADFFRAISRNLKCALWGRSLWGTWRGKKVGRYKTEYMCLNESCKE